MKQFVALIFSFIAYVALSQATEPIVLQQDLKEVHVDKDFDRKYQSALRKLRRVYPLALQAKVLIVQYDGDMQELEKNRQKRKYGKKAQKSLKDEFLYDIKDLYIDEGILLMKLIHRETGMTVSDIITSYRGKLHANLYEGMGKIWDQDLEAKYDPDGEDWIVEVVINDIIHKRVAFDWDIQPIDKTQYKENMKDYRQSRKEFKKIRRQTKKAGSKTVE